MTIDSVKNITPIIQYIATAGQTVFPYPFPITAAADISVTVNAVATGAFTLTGIGSDTGGNVVLNAGSAVGDIVTVFRSIIIQRITQLAQNGGFSSTAFNAEFNNIYLILQQIAQSLQGSSPAFALTVPISNNPRPNALLTPTAYANKYLSFDANGNPTPAALTASGVLTASIVASLLNAYTAGTVNSSVIGTPQTAAELVAVITPVNTQYKPYEVPRYMSAAQLADWLAGTMLVDQTSAFAAAEAAAYLGGFGKIYAPAGQYLFQGTVTLRSGVVLGGDGAGGSEYFPGSTFNTTQVTLLRKTSTGASGPMFIIQTSSQVKGVYLKYELIGGCATGVIQVGTTAHATPFVDGVFNAELEDVSFYGPAIASAALVDSTCTAIYFYDGNVGSAVQRYGNRVRGARITNFYTAVRLGDNCNQNNFSSMVIRQCYQHYVLDGGTAENTCLENSFTGLSSFNQGQLPTVPMTFTPFTMRAHAAITELVIL